MIRDRQTDGQTPGEKQDVSQPLGGRHNDTTHQPVSSHGGSIIHTLCSFVFSFSSSDSAMVVCSSRLLRFMFSVSAT